MTEPTATNAAPDTTVPAETPAPEPAPPAAEATTASRAEEAAHAAAPGLDSAPTAPTATLPPPTPMRPELLLVYAAHQEKRKLLGKVIGWNKGGFHVSLAGVPAFCPRSHMELGHPKKPGDYLDRELEFRVLDIKEDGKRVVLSRASVLSEERSSHVAKIKSAAAIGEPLTGRVTSLTDFGAFVDLGGVQGMVHVTAITRRRIEKPGEALAVGQEVTVRVLKVEKKGERISLSIKALEPDPWDSIEERAPLGAELRGKVLRKTDFGLFVEIEPGVDGLLHSSQLPLGKTITDAAFAEGAVVTVFVKEVAGKRRRLSLSMRAVATTDPWQTAREKYPEGAAIKGKVEQVTRSGVIVELEPGLTGMLPTALLNLPADAMPQRMFRVGSELMVVVGEIDLKRKRIALLPVGARPEGTKADLREYQKRQRGPAGKSAMAAAFAKIEDRT